MEARLQALEARVAELEIDRELLVSCVVLLAFLTIRSRLANRESLAGVSEDQLLPTVAARLEEEALRRGY